MNRVSLIRPPIDFKELKLADKTQSYLSFTSNVRDFIKERAELEREFAKKLEGLVKRHSKRNHLTTSEPVAASASVAPLSGAPSAPVTSGILVEEWASTRDAWERIVADTNEQAKIHSQLADMLISTVADKLKILYGRKEESRKKHLAFATRFIAECDRSESELAKSKADYDEACDLVDAAKGKFERATDERQREKLKRAWHQDILDMNNQKNIYLLTLETTNRLHERYEQIEIPIVVEQFEYFGASVNSSILKIWKQYVSSHKEMLRSHQDVMEGMMFMIDTVDSSAGTKIKLSSFSNKSIFNLSKHSFKPCGLWTDEPNLVSDEYSSVYLGNKLERLKIAAKASDQEIQKRKAGYDGLLRLYQSFVQNPLAGEADVIKETMIEESRSIFMLEHQRFKYRTLIDTITNLIGEFPQGSCMHKFRNCSFPVPTTCDFCSHTIWGVKHVGLTCNDCGFSAHLKCEMKISPSCSGVKGVIERRKKRTISDPYQKLHITSPLATHRVTSLNPHDMVEVEKQIDKLEIDQSTNSNHSSPKKSPGRAKIGIIEPLDVEIVSAPIEKIEVVPSVVPLEKEKVPILIKEDRAELPGGWNSTIYPSLTEAARPSTLPPIEKHSEPLQVIIESTSPVEADISSRTLLEVDVTAQVVYDYFATNPEEVNIHEGEHVVVVKLDDGSGWTMINKSGLTGIVPTSYITPLENVISSTTLNTTLNANDHDHGIGHALYSYTKNAPEELSIKAGEVIKILQDDDGSGWVLATNGKEDGLLPSAYVKLLS